MIKKSLFAAFALAAAFSASAAVTATEIYTPATGLLRVGSGYGSKASQNANVKAAQMALNACNGSNLAIDGKFGPMTAAQFRAFQTAKSIKVDGVIGAQTAATLAACSTGSTTPVTPVTPVVSGTEGTLSTVTKLGTYNNEKIAESAKDMKVLALEVRAQDADQKIDGLIVSFKKTTDTGTAGNSRFSRSAADVSVWLNDAEIGRKATTAFSDDASEKYTYRFSGMNGVVKAGTTARIYVAVSANATLDSKDLDDTWSVYLDSNAISATSPNGRYRDYSLSNTGIQTSFYFQSLSAGDTKYRVNKGSTSPAAMTIQGSTTGDTTNKLLLAVDLKAENNEMVLQRLPIDLVTTGANTSEVIKNIELKINGKTLENKSAIASAVTETVIFGDSTKLNFKMDKNTTYKVEVFATLNKMTGNFGSGDTVKANYSDANRTATTIETSIGDSISSTNRTGNALGDIQTVYAEGVAVNVTAKSATAANGATASDVAKKATATFSVDMTSFNNTVYVPAAGSLAATINLVKGSDLTTTAMTVTVVKPDGDATQAIGGTAGNSYQVSGTEGFNLSADVASPAAGTYYAELVNIKVYDSAGALVATIPVTGQKTNTILLN